MRRFRHARLLAGVWLCMALLAACVHRAPLMDARVAGLPARMEQGDTPFFPQAWYQCGAAYRAATEKWPDNALTWLGLGNAEYALGQAAQAEAAFRRALDVQADTAAAWNNLAYTLAARLCMRSAREAAHCASHMAPGNPAITQTLQEPEGRPAPGARRPACLPCALKPDISQSGAKRRLRRQRPALPPAYRRPAGGRTAQAACRCA